MVCDICKPDLDETGSSCTISPDCRSTRMSRQKKPLDEYESAGPMTRQRLKRQREGSEEDIWGNRNNSNNPKRIDVTPLDAFTIASSMRNCSYGSWSKSLSGPPRPPRLPPRPPPLPPPPTTGHRATSSAASAARSGQCFIFLRYFEQRKERLSEVEQYKIRRTGFMLYIFERKKIKA